MQSKPACLPHGKFTEDEFLLVWFVCVLVNMGQIAARVGEFCGVGLPLCGDPPIFVDLVEFTYISLDH